MNAHSQARLAELAPQVRDMWMTANDMLVAEGIDAEVTQGLRTFNTQAALYAQGRESLAQVNEKRTAIGLAAITEEQNSRPVTWAKPGESWHQYECALDSVPFVSGQPIWDVAHPSFARMVAVARSVGFVCGADWEGQKKDSDHFQFTGRFGTSPNGEVMQLWRDGGVQAVLAAAFGEAA